MSFFVADGASQLRNLLIERSGAEKYATYPANSLEGRGQVLVGGFPRFKLQKRMAVSEGSSGVS